MSLDISTLQKIWYYDLPTCQTVNGSPGIAQNGAQNSSHVTAQIWAMRMNSVRVISLFELSALLTLEI